MISSDEMTLINKISALTLKVARPLVWHDASEAWPKRLQGGTCFILRFDNLLVGVTAEHVVRAFESALERQAETICLLRTVRLDLLKSIIHRNAALDIATFKVTEEQLLESEAIAVDCRSEWPPPEPDRGRELSLCGFPEALKRLSPHEMVEFRALVDLTKAEDITDRTIIATHELNRDIRILAAPELPNIGANWSGCSGGPVLMHVERDGLHRWFAIGLILEGPGQSPDGTMQEFDKYLLRRIHCIDTNGEIKNSNAGWLPGRSLLT